MIEISITKFIDFVHKSGTPKMTCLKAIKKQYAEGYTPGGDYYKLLREKLVDILKNDGEISKLDEVLKLVKQKSKIENYRQCMNGVKLFLNKHNVVWCCVSRGEWKYDDLSVIVNPELVVKLDGKKYAIKLYFKPDKISKAKSECIFYLFEHSLDIDGSYTPAILNCREGKLIQKTKDIPDVDILLKAEAQTFISMWNSL